MKYNKKLLDKFINEKVAIVTRTQKEFDGLMELLEKETDLTWSWGENPTENKDSWCHEKHETAVVCGFFNKGEVGFSSKEFYKEHGYEIIEYKDLVKGDKGMKTKEFIERIEVLGYEIDNNGNDYIRVMHNEEVFAFVGKRKNYHIDTTISCEEVPVELFNLLVEYVSRPINEREEEPKFLWKIKGLGSKTEHTLYFNYNRYDALWRLDNKIESGIYKTQLTEKRFKELKEYLGIELEFEKEEIGE